MELITGYRAKAHFTSRQHRSIYERIIGPDSYILEQWENLATELQSNNRLAIRSGMLCHHGAIAEVPQNTYDTVTLNNGSQGMKRKDLIVCRYTKNAENEVENMEFIAIQGVPSETDPIVPEHTEGNMQDGDLVDDCPFAIVEYDGIQVVSVTPLLEIVGGTLAELNKKMTDCERFSTSEEIDTGETWHDGRKIYRRTYVTTETIPNAGVLTIPISGIPIKEIWHDPSNSFLGTNGTVYSLPMVAYGGDSSVNVYVYVNSSGIRLGSSKGGWNTGWNKTVTVRYTKL